MGRGGGVVGGSLGGVVGGVAEGDERGETGGLGWMEKHWEAILLAVSGRDARAHRSRRRHSSSYEDYLSYVQLLSDHIMVT